MQLNPIRNYKNLYSPFKNACAHFTNRNLPKNPQNPLNPSKSGRPRLPWILVFATPVDPPRRPWEQRHITVKTAVCSTHAGRNKGLLNRIFGGVNEHRVVNKQGVFQTIIHGKNSSSDFVSRAAKTRSTEQSRTWGPILQLGSWSTRMTEKPRFTERAVLDSRPALPGSSAMRCDVMLMFRLFVLFVFVRVAGVLPGLFGERACLAAITKRPCRRRHARKRAVIGVLSQI